MTGPRSSFWIWFANGLFVYFTSEVKIDVRRNFSELILSLDSVTSTILGGHIRDVKCQSGNNKKNNDRNVRNQVMD